MPDFCFRADGTQRVLRFALRFLNVVEPGPEMVLSWTRIGMMLAIIIFSFCTVYLTIFSPGNLAGVIGAAVSAAPFVVNYIHQRYCDRKDGTNCNSAGRPDPKQDGDQ